MYYMHQSRGENGTESESESERERERERERESERGWKRKVKVTQERRLHRRHYREECTVTC